MARTSSPERRVLHVSMPTDAGVARVVVGYVAEQVAGGYAVSVACPEQGWLAAAASAAGAQVIRWPATRSPGVRVPDETARLARIIARADPDVVHLHSAKAGLAGRLALRGRRPTVFQPHAWSFLAGPGPVRAAAMRWERFAARWTDILLCVSDGERLAGLGRGVRAPYRVVHNGVDPDEWSVATGNDRIAARDRLGLPADGPLAVCVGRLCAQKGQADLLAAWPVVLSSAPDAHLVLVGDGPDRLLLEQRASRTRGVTLAGERRDVADWMAAADLVVVPSRWDGMALVVIEALARARCVVATAAAGAADALPPSAGVVVPLGDPLAFAQEIVVRLVDPARRDAEGTVGRRHVEHHLDQATSARAVMSLYDQVISCRPVSSAPAAGSVVPVEPWPARYET